MPVVRTVNYGLVWVPGKKTNSLYNLRPRAYAFEKLKYWQIRKGGGCTFVELLVVSQLFLFLVTIRCLAVWPKQHEFTPNYSIK